MKRLVEKRERRERRIRRVKKATRPKSDRLRLIVNKSNRNIRAQIIDDKKSVTLCYAGSDEKDFGKSVCNKETAKKVGAAIAKRASEKGITKVYLDRRGNLYHGRIAAFAEAARENGLEF